MNFTITFCFILIFISRLFAQDRIFEAELYYSPVMSTNLGEDSEYYYTPGENHAVFLNNFGIDISKNIKEHIYVECGIAFSQKGYKFSQLKEFSFEETELVYEKSTYFTFPVRVGYYKGIFHVAAGIDVNFLIAEYGKISGKNYIKLQTNSHNRPVILGI